MGRMRWAPVPVSRKLTATVVRPYDYKHLQIDNAWHAVCFKEHTLVRQSRLSDDQGKKSMSRYLGAVAGAVLLTGGIAGTAQAVPYAYANVNFSNVALSGLANPNVTITGATVTTSSSANYPGAAGSANSAPATNSGTGLTPLTGGSDAVQSTSGTGPFPGQNVFTQALQAGSGSRGDSVITGNLTTGSGSASDVAEGRLTAPGSAASSGGTTTGFSLNATVAATTTLVLDLSASTSLIATTTAVGDGASAQINASFTVTGANGVISNFAPTELNRSVSSTSNQGNASLSTGLTAYTNTVTLAPGTYQISLLSGAQERLEAVAAVAPPAVPEPASLALLGAGLLGLGMARRRQQG